MEKNKVIDVIKDPEKFTQLEKIQAGVSALLYLNVTSDINLKTFVEHLEQQKGSDDNG